ncbi:MAG: elongation factor G [Acidimicrobiia bacterium]
MKSYPTGKIRNVALVGHGGSGKTTLAEALLLRASAISRAGRVEDGTTVCDFEPEEHKHHQSISLSLAPFEWQGHKINLIDTPGYADFIGDVEAALAVADLVVFVVSAVDGVEVQTEIIWKLAARAGVPRMFFLNKLDRERASFESTLEEIRSKFGAGVAPLELPIGQETAFTGIADLLSDTAFIYNGDGSHVTAEIPEELEAIEHQVHDALVEGIVVADDEQLERFLEGDIPSPEELEHTLAHGVAGAQVFPVVCGSALTGVGIDRLADFLCEIGPSPADRDGVAVEAGGDLHEVAPDPNGQPLAYVFKTIADPYVGQLSLFKALSGTIRPDDRLINPRTGNEERLHGIFTLRGKEQTPATEVVAGDIAAVAKLAGTSTNDTLAPKGTPVRVPAREIHPPVLSMAIKARTQADEDKLSTALSRLREEDPALVVDRNDETKQTLIRGTGDTHLQVALERLQRKFGVNVDTEDVLVPYRETITRAAEAEGKFKKQSGGHGQFGVCYLKVEPMERGGGFEFVDQIVGGAIPRQFIPAVEKGIQESMERGGAFGFPVVDVRVYCTDGKYHAVDSSEMSFKMAGSIGFQECMHKAEAVVLEPISVLRITVPSAYQGDVMGDVNARRGRVQGTDAVGDGEQEVTAIVPTSEIMRYAIDLRSMTGGRGRFTADHSHYEILPSHLTAKVARKVAQPA